MTVDLFIAVAECMPVVLHERRRDGWIAEARMASGIGRRSIRNIAARGLDTVMVSLLSNLRVRWRRRWRVIGGRLGMRAPSKCEGKQYCCQHEQFLHDVALVCRASINAASVKEPALGKNCCAVMQN
jgi:hypothetical protein